MRFFTTVYSLLLAYIIATLVFWGISLQKQSQAVFNQEEITLHEHVDSVKQPVLFKKELAALESRRDLRTKQYLGEGIVSLIVILIGAGVVYNSFRRSIKLSRQQHNFMLAVTHELKSPIAGIKLSLQTIEKRALSDEQRLLLIARCITESDRLNDLCNNMLLTSQMEGGQYKPAKEMINFSEMVEESLMAYISRYPDRFIMDLADDVMISGDVTLLQMAIHNLLENALKYTPSDTHVRVMLTEDSDMVRLRVIDEGNGIPDEEKRKIFSKFYRIGDETTRKTKGTGLGLYLTAHIIKQHKGRISVKNNIPVGSIFEICLPHP
jgi:K+-sensing histidine kinase KdpD